MIKIAVIAAVFLVFAMHAVYGYESTVGAYRIVLTTSQDLKAEKSATLAIALEDAENGKRISDFDAAVVIKDGNSVVFSAPAMQLDENGEVVFEYAFPRSATYTVEFSIKELNLSTILRVDVNGNEDDAILGILVAVVIVVAVLLYLRRKKYNVLKEERA